MVQIPYKNKPGSAANRRAKPKSKSHPNWQMEWAEVNEGVNLDLKLVGTFLSHDEEQSGTEPTLPSNVLQCGASANIFYQFFYILVVKWSI